MLAEHGNISVGIDLGRDYSQIAFCSKSDRAPLMVMQSEEEKEENDYLIRTPVDLFSLVERKDARGVEVLYQFLKECFALLKGAGSVEHMTVMVTMHEMKGIWADPHGTFKAWHTVLSHFFAGTSGELLCLFNEPEKRASDVSCRITGIRKRLHHGMAFLAGAKDKTGACKDGKMFPAVSGQQSKKRTRGRRVGDPQGFASA